MEVSPPSQGCALRMGDPIGRASLAKSSPKHEENGSRERKAWLKVSLRSEWCSVEVTCFDTMLQIMKEKESGKFKYKMIIVPEASANFIHLGDANI